MKIILSLFLYAIIFSCSSPAKHEENNQDRCTEYACPMHPDKTSTKPGICPECNIKLVPPDSVKTDSSTTRARVFFKKYQRINSEIACTNF